MIEIWVQHSENGAMVGLGCHPPHMNISAQSYCGVQEPSFPLAVYFLIYSAVETHCSIPLTAVATSFPWSISFTLLQQLGFQVRLFQFLSFSLLKLCYQQSPGFKLLRAFNLPRVTDTDVRQTRLKRDQPTCNLLAFVILNQLLSVDNDVSYQSRIKAV